MTDYSSAIPPDVRADILTRLEAIERDNDVRITLAVESGSRAWGFASNDSDYDVRFLYVRSHDWHCSINVEGKRDVIECPITDNLDISGWDIRKALRLLYKSNPPLLEWLHSPIIYRELHEAAKPLRATAQRYYSKTSSFYHYLHMAKGNDKNYLQREEVWTKKYLYVLRPLLAIKWSEANQGVPPLDFERVVNEVVDDNSVRTAIGDLLARKRNGDELGTGPRIPALDNFITSEFERHKAEGISKAERPPDIENLNVLFRWIIKEAAQ